MPVSHATRLLELIEHTVRRATSAIAVPVMKIGNAMAACLARPVDAAIVVVRRACAGVVLPSVLRLHRWLSLQLTSRRLRWHGERKPGCRL